jgi:hypothetical protein
LILIVLNDRLRFAKVLKFIESANRIQFLRNL